MALPGMPDLTMPGERSPANSSGAPRIPLQAGLTITTAVATAEGDIETSKRITAADAGAILVEVLADPAGSAGSRRVLRDDLASARSWRHAFAIDGTTAYPGTTALGVSSRVLHDIKDAFSSELTLDVGGVQEGAGIDGADVAGELDAMLGGMGGFAGIEEAVNRQQEQGTISEGERAQGAADVADIRALGLATGRLRSTGPSTVPVIVNDRRVELAGIGATGSLSNGKDDVAVSMTLLDDPDNPLALQLQIDGESTQLVRVAYAQSSSAYVAGIDQALRNDCHVDVHALAFAPGAATLLPGSDDALQALRRVFAGHPDWRVAVISHGDDRQDTLLSTQRAASVVQALADAGSARLVAVPLPRVAALEPNDTLAGRAANRRVTFALAGCAP
jgi:flagellar motor protein MotB